LLLSLAGELQFKVHVVSKTPSGTHPISSSRIRSLVKKGKVSESAEMLGRLYTIEGRVAKGAGRGKNLGYPTVNLEEVRNLLPAPGIYITETQVRGKTLPSVSYLGPRLTFGESSPAIESHILDYHEEVYGDWVRLAFISKIRGTMKFRSPEELKEAIAKDVARARRYFERSGSLPKDGKTGS
jgi:riboflavin kinase/FMN adenylyltransferase